MLTNLRRKGGHEETSKVASFTRRDIRTEESGGSNNGKRQDTDDLSTVMAPIRTELNTSFVSYTKRHNSSLLMYCVMYSATFGIDAGTFGERPQGDAHEAGKSIRKELMILLRFSSFVFTHPRRNGQNQNSNAHEEIAGQTVYCYYEHMQGKVPETGRGLYFTPTFRIVTVGFRKLYPGALISRVPLLSFDIRYIIRVTKWTIYKASHFWPFGHPKGKLIRITMYAVYPGKT